jgi:hypothetical protein
MPIGMTPRLFAAKAIGGEASTQLYGQRGVFGVGDDVLLGPRPRVPGNDLATADGCHLSQSGRYVDEPANHTWIDRVVDSVDPHVVVAGQPDPLIEPDRRRKRWQRDHRVVVGVEQIDGAALDGRHHARIRATQPVSELGIEVRW